MKILHTSDWHLGRSLYSHKRYDEFTAFLDWLVELVKAESIDAILVAGDIFDNSTPSNHFQSLYYDFLGKIAKSCCKFVIITAGNHDSPTFLAAPKELLKALNVHIIGSISDNLDDEIVLLEDDNDALVVCAVPYLRDKDVRTSEAGETIEDKNKKLIMGIKNHYHSVCKRAKEIYPENLPLVVTGHLFTQGGKTLDDDGVRELYVGSLAHIPATVFPANIDYLALGHLHIPQKVFNSDKMRYSGSPLPIGFGEAYQTKKVIIVEFEEQTPIVKEVAVPCFRKLERISGDLMQIESKFNELKGEKSNALLEVNYSGKEIISDLSSRLDSMIENTEMKLLRVFNKSLVDRVIKANHTEETLEEMDVNDVFERRLEASEISGEEKKELQELYRQILNSIDEADIRAE